MKLQLTFKSGAQVEVDSDSIETRRDPLSGDLTNMKWKSPDDWTRKLHTVDMDEIVCIVAVRSKSEDALSDTEDKTEVA